MKKYTKILISSCMAIIISITLLMWLIDPFRIFHKPWVRDNYYISDIMIQASGIINTDDFDSLILGSSMASNFSPNEATKLFGNRFINISIEGASIAERSMVLRYALEKRHISNAIISIDWHTLNKDSIRNTPMEFYQYLYDANRLNDIIIYLNYKYLRFIFYKYIVFYSGKSIHQEIKNIENLAEWYSNMNYSKRFGGLIKWLADNNSKKVIASLKEITENIKNIDAGHIQSVNMNKLFSDTKMHGKVFNEYLLKYAIHYQRTKFFLFFPPYSRLKYAILAQSQQQRFYEYLENLRFIVKECSKYPNVKVFGFETEGFLDDIANYKDTIHYHPRFNSMMLNWMAQEEHVLTPSNIEPYINQVTKRAKDYSLKEIGEQISTYISNLPSN